jgi:hypothetical protein
MTFEKSIFIIRAENGTASRAKTFAKAFPLRAATCIRARYGTFGSTVNDSPGMGTGLLTFTIGRDI